VPKISRRILAQTVVDQLLERPKDHQRILQSLAAYLVEHKQVKQLDLLLLDIASRLSVTADQLYAEVTSPYPLDDTARREVQTYLQKTTGAKHVELDEQLNPDLLAGVVVRTASLELDTSARTKLKQLASLQTTTEKV